MKLRELFEKEITLVDALNGTINKCEIASEYLKVMFMSVYVTESVLLKTTNMLVCLFDDGELIFTDTYLRKQDIDKYEIPELTYTTSSISIITSFPTKHCNTEV